MKLWHPHIAGEAPTDETRCRVEVFTRDSYRSAFNGERKQCRHPATTARKIGGVEGTPCCGQHARIRDKERSDENIRRLRAATLDDTWGRSDALRAKGIKCSVEGPGRVSLKIEDLEGLVFFIIKE